MSWRPSEPAGAGGPRWPPERAGLAPAAPALLVVAFVAKQPSARGIGSRCSRPPVAQCPRVREVAPLFPSSSAMIDISPCGCPPSLLLLLAAALGIPWAKPARATLLSQIATARFYMDSISLDADDALAPCPAYPAAWPRCLPATRLRTVAATGSVLACLPACCMHAMAVTHCFVSQLGQLGGREDLQAGACPQ